MLMRSIRWDNGTVVSRDESGKLIPELSGDWSVVGEKVTRDVADHVSLAIGDFETGATMTVSSRKFLAYDPSAGASASASVSTSTSTGSETKE